MMRLFHLFVAMLYLALPASAQAAWLEAKTRHFHFYSEGRPEALRQFVIKVERFDAVLRERFGVKDGEEPQPLTIFMLPTNEAVAKLGGRGKNLAGFYEPHDSGSLAVVHREGANSKYDMGADTVLFHEYAHHFMLRYFPIAYPAWYVEGFAEFISTTDFTKTGNAKIGTPPYYRAYGLLEQAPIPVAKLITSNTSDFPQDRIDSFYGRSWLLVHYLSYAPTRAGQLSKYLRAINEGKTSLEAAKLGFGDLDVLDADLTAYLKQAKISVSQMVKPTPEPENIGTSALSPGASALVPHRLALMRQPQVDQVAPTVSALQAITTQFPQEADAFRLLGEAQVIAEAYDAADAAADAALRLDPKLSRAMMVKATVATHRYESAAVACEAKAKEMRSWIVKANRADTNDPLPLIANYRSYELQGLRPNKTALDGLSVAYRMVPEDPNVRMRYANALANDGQYDAAIRLVETVAFDPHQNTGSNAASAMLDALKQAKAKFPSAADPESGRKPKP